MKITITKPLLWDVIQEGHCPKCMAMDGWRKIDDKGNSHQFKCINCGDQISLAMIDTVGNLKIKNMCRDANWRKPRGHHET